MFSKRATFIGLSIPGIILVYYLLSSSKDPYTLFHIERNKDENQINYDIRLKEDGSIDLEDPINIYWIKYTEGGKKEPLNYVQRKLAYGLKFLQKEKDQIKFQFVSYSARNFYLKKLKGRSEYNVITYLDNRTVIVKSIYVHIAGGTYMVPEIAYLILYWKDPYSNAEGKEKVIP